MAYIVRVFCPWCRHEAPASQWFTQAQLEFVRKMTERHAHEYITGQLKQIANAFNRSQQRNLLISMRLDLKLSTPPRMFPCEVAKIMEQRFE